MRTVTDHGITAPVDVSGLEVTIAPSHDGGACGHRYGSGKASTVRVSVWAGSTLIASEETCADCAASARWAIQQAWTPDSRHSKTAPVPAPKHPSGGGSVGETPAEGRPVPCG